MITELDKNTFWNDPKSGHKIIDAFNELVREHNDLCQAHDLLVEEFKEASDTIDMIVDAVFEHGPTELDS